MKKFKIFFYPIYIIVTLVTLYFSVDFLNRMASDKDAFYTFLMREFGLTNLPIYGTVLFLVISLLMIMALIIENIHIFRLNKKLSNAEKELLTLKAKMYDRSQAPAEELELSEDTFDEEDATD